MSATRGRTRLLILSDLSAVALCLLLLGNVLADSIATTSITIAPVDADARMLGVDVLQAKRRAIITGQPIEIEFRHRDDGSMAYGFRQADKLPVYGYQLPAERELEAGARFEGVGSRLVFLPNGRPENQARIVFSQASGELSVVIGESGEIRLTNDRM